jgi:KUP system potassium uptake protein
LELTTIGEGFYRLVARYGFMESPDINDILKCAATKGVPFELSDITFFLGRETILPTHREGMAIWRERIFAFMSQNSERATAFFNIPPDQVVEVGFLVEF